ncbi:amidohydrolase [Streptomyces sp. NPDC056361]|uniref:amidohydrolase n=1 Tax=Streptomyces sp. NPDC056361 TaxID=3345795 RepID=UPI0035DCB046
MRPQRLVSTLVTCLLVTVLSSCDDGTKPASDGPPATVVVNAEVYTLDRGRPWAEAFAYDADGKITAVGTESDVRAKAGSGAKVIDARGNMVLPGFQDTHLHVPEAGINRDLCFMESGSTLAEYEDMAADCAAEQPGSSWVRAAGPSLFDLLDADESPIDVLDRAIPDRPALILDDLGHAVWTNSLGLKAAGIGPDDPDPQGGIYGRDPETGRLNGLLLENAQQRIRNAAAPDDEVVYKGLLVALDELAKNGITSASDAGGFWGQNHPAAWQRALKEGELSVRAVNGLYLYPDADMKEQLAEFQRRFSDDPNSLLRFNTAKIYLDGILDLGTAWMLKPYDKPINPQYPSGFPYFERDQLRTYVSELHRIGYRMHFHVIGDAATREALDAVEAIDAPKDQVADRRHRTTHTYLVHPDDTKRFAELGVVADFQVGPEAIDPGYHEQLSDFIGNRAFDLIPVAKLLDAGAHVSLSSDWDADPLSPFGIIERAVTRESNAVDSVETAVKLVTLDAAYALGQDDTTGSIEVGKQADYVIVDQNLLEVPVDRVDQTKVLLTVLAGESTYQAASFNR